MRWEGGGGGSHEDWDWMVCDLLTGVFCRIRLSGYYALCMCWQRWGGGWHRNSDTRWLTIRKQDVVMERAGCIGLCCGLVEVGVGVGIGIGFLETGLGGPVGWEWVRWVRCCGVWCAGSAEEGED